MERKKCSTCSEKKPIAEFNKNKNRKDGLNNICRVCSNEYSKKYYNENTDKHKKVIIERHNKIIKENRVLLYNYYKVNPCVDCGEDNPIVLELDHKNSDNKTMIISKMISGGYCWDRIKNEIGKCDVRCANCHRIRTAKQFGWYKDLLK